MVIFFSRNHFQQQQELWVEALDRIEAVDNQTVGDVRDDAKVDVGDNLSFTDDDTRHYVANIARWS